MKNTWYINGKGEVVDFGDKLYKISVSYNKGGMNYFNYKQEARGYYVHVMTGVDRKERNGFISEGMMMFGGFKICLCTVKRASAKTEAAVVAQVAAEIERIAQVVAADGSDESKQNEIGNILFGLKEEA